ncbi:DUF4132 domain-containing protein [Kurthia sibirica]|uniref:DUF4132 domain-containing protein n=1 Tax=Kurthia sibirica TaxID=202750 RepID=A0A2U3AJL2_9BACL|nr:DUF4132 domain-containing protein [Kurthia sibirica]PWI24753.1 hypothetical protein DEX24_11540 [Kurthia sibirica]GEK35121.1 hypothetical protein KSI01_26540 [Kurthia sibirica]
MLSKEVVKRIKLQQNEWSITQKKVIAKIRQAEQNKKNEYWEGEVEEFEKIIMMTGSKTIKDLFDHILFEIMDVIVGRQEALQIQQIALALESKSDNQVEENIHKISSLVFGAEQNVHVNMDDVLTSVLEGEYYCGEIHNTDCFEISWLQDRSEKIMMTNAFFSLKLQYELSHNNERYSTQLRAFIYERNDELCDKELLIQAIMQSRHPQLLEVFGKCLIVGQHQEGLREKIVKFVAEAQAETKLYFMTIVEEQKLMRYAFMRNAIRQWLHIETEEQQVFNEVMRLYKNSSQLPLALSSDNPLTIHAALLVAVWTDPTYTYNHLAKGSVAQQLTLSYYLYKKKTLEKSDDHLLFHLILSTNQLDILTFAIVKLAENKLYNDQLYDENSEISYEFRKYSHYPQSLFERIDAILMLFTKKHQVEIAPFEEVVLTVEPLYSIQIMLAIVANNEQWKNYLYTKKTKMTMDNRFDLLHMSMGNKVTASDRLFVLSLLRDRSEMIRMNAINYVEQWTLNSVEVTAVQQLFTAKNKEIRYTAVKLLASLPAQTIEAVLEHLLTSKKQLLRDGGEMLFEVIQAKEGIPQEQIMYFKQLMTGSVKIPPIKYEAENGFGLFTPNYPLTYTIARPNLLRGNLQQLLNVDDNKVRYALKQLTRTIQQNLEKEFDFNDGHQTMKMMLFDFEWACSDSSTLPFHAMWLQWAQENNVTYEELSMMECCLTLINETGYNSASKTVSSELLPIMQQFFDFEKLDTIIRYLVNSEMQNTIMLIVKTLKKERVVMDENRLFTLYYNAYNELLQDIDDVQWRWLATRKKGQQNDHLFKHHLIESIFMQCKSYTKSEEQFKKLMALHFERESRISGSRVIKYMDLQDLDRAITAGYLPQDALYEQLVDQDSNVIEELFNRELTEETNWLVGAKDSILTRLFDIELARGESCTVASKLLLTKLNNYQNTKLFAKAVQAIGKEKRLKNTHSFENNYSRMTILCHLLESSRPEADLTIEQFTSIIAPYNFTEEQLLNCMFYENAWVPYISAYLGWSGLDSAAWLWIAYSSEQLDEYEYSSIASYTTVTKQQLSEGVLDCAWFEKCLAQVDARQWALIQTCANNSKENIFYHRIKLYAKIKIEKITSADLKEEIRAKRNKEKVQALGLVSLNEATKLEDALVIYEFLQDFLQQSQQYGAQRRKSEKKAVDIAVANLAQNYGEEMSRFMWKMEMLHVTQLATYGQPTALGEYLVALTIDEDGLVDIRVEKALKYVKKIPSSLNNEPYLVELKRVKKRLNEQLIRCRKLFEEAMVNRTRFQFEELRLALTHPIFAPIIKKLVFCTMTNRQGVLCQKGVQQIDGRIDSLAYSDELIVCHPYEIHQQGNLPSWQEKLTSNHVKQPFQQVFRALYFVEEKKQLVDECSRFAKQQIQPIKAKFLLESRGWMVNQEDEMTKFFAGEEVNAILETIDSWHMMESGDIMTLVNIRFCLSTSPNQLMLNAVPPIIYSETIRDLTAMLDVSVIENLNLATE